MKNLFYMGFKNAAVLLLIFVLLVLAPAARYAAAQIDPFEKIIMSKDTELFDSTDDQGSNNQPIQYVEGFGIGYSYAGDCVIIRDVDFSEKQAKAISVFMANGDGEPLNLSVHINDINSEPVAAISISPTNGYTRDKAKLFCADFDSPIEGTATVYIKWLDKTGNMFEVEFYDDYFAVEGEFKEEKADHTNSPPPTGDNIDIFAMLTFAAAFAGVLIWKKRCNYKV